MHHTQEREQKIRLWLDMWLRREDLGILAVSYTHLTLPTNSLV